MDKFDYNEANADAKGLVDEFGQKMTITKPDNSQKQDFVGVLMDLSFKDKQNALLSEATAKVITASDLKRDPSDDGDRVTIGKDRYAVVATDTMRPAGIDVYHVLYIRK